ncbi:M20/M25/M40 family metallo-hydrolase [Kallotenue papyrolyticum]|uniref:M20/M25/M40 family metallo-hydrolase n=1 Tax=Kallotenue papyrolyticum TaxID=1325125 RepID=UPI0004786345|nr:M20/M25/M40 family metallo-hydrolase [Kallotenue papyrolyticum]
MSTAAHAAIDWQAAGDEMIDHLRALLRLDTRNPPGNERLAAEYLQAVLVREGIASQIVGPSPERATLIARLQGDGSAAPLLLMSHTDVVAVEPDKWSYDPFAATVTPDGWLYGRGALDMKHMVAMELMTLLLLKRAGVPLKRDVIFMAAADEETGGEQGAGWVVRHHPELIQAEYALNEGGGVATEINGRRYYTVQTAEKGTARFRLRARGTPGHGSRPHPDNAILKLAAALARLREQQPPAHFTKSLRGFVEGIAAAQPPEVAAQLRAVLADEAGVDAAIAALPLPESFKLQLNAMVRNTIAPTMLRAGTQINVIPSEAEAGLDGRMLPGWTTDRFREEIRAIVGDELELEFLDDTEPLEADPESPLFDTIRAVLAEHDPEARAIPTLLTGATDAKHVAKLGIKVYGFAPWPYDGPDEWSRIHGHDERISLRAARWGVRVLYDVVARFAGA